MSLSYGFHPWVREGLAAGIAATDDAAAQLPARAASSVGIEVNDRTVSSTMRLMGPGDVVGIDPDQIVRNDPDPGTDNAEPNLFPAIEFDRADFPWLFTPAKAGANGRLRPWLVLVTVRIQAGVEIVASAPLPILRIAGDARPVNELPDLDESWAWAHAQVLGSDNESMQEKLSARSVRNLSRLLSPRRLAPGTRYITALVPAFEQGRLAGLGQPVDETAPLAPAWGSGALAPEEIDLPIYHHWQFGTGERGDFESLVRRLQPRPLPRSVGTRGMAVGELGFGLPDLGIIPLGGVLRSPGTVLGIVPRAFKDALRDVLNLPFEQATDPGIVPDEPLVGPPVYGRLQARTRAVPERGGTPRWLRGLNLDPRYRLAAGLGATVVQDLQEELMASAWQQLAEVDEANQLRAQAQLAVQVGRVVRKRHLENFSTDRIFQVASPAGTRMRLSPMTVSQALAGEAVAPAATSGAFRRISRPRGIVARRFGFGTNDPAPDTPPQLFTRLALWRGPSFFIRFDGIAYSNHVRGRMAALNSAVQNPADNAAQARRFAGSLNRMAAYVEQSASLRFAQDQKRLRNAPAPNPPLAEMRTTLLTRLDPVKTVAARVQKRLVDASGTATNAEDAIDPTLPMPHPVFHRPMYEALAGFSQELLMPGISQVPDDTITLAETDPRFVEAFMIGLNHEMSRELLWRRYPTDQRGTYFRRFWDTSGSPGDPGEQIDPIHEWAPGVRLGENILGARGPGRLVLLMRGGLLRRYPGATIFAVRPSAPGTFEPGEKHYPIFRGSLAPDIVFLGFDLSLEQIRDDEDGEPWYFMIQQPPTDLRFGMDVPEAFGAGAPPIASWNDLSWGHVVETAEELAALGHAPAGGRLVGTLADGLSWGHNSAHMAGITMQRPARIAIRASVIVPQTGRGDD